MDVSYQWLQELVDLPVPAEELADKVSRTGIEVAGVTHPASGMKKVVVGRVMALAPHPDSDHLQVAQVDTGEEALRQIVCGAPNIQADQTVIVALPGARIGDNVKIKRGKMRGVVSDGMICALQELGFSDSVAPKAYEDGIYVFNEALAPGSDALAALGMYDAIMDFDLTPNRADALGMRGVAWEVGATYNTRPHFDDQPVVEGTTPISDYLQATVEAPQAAPSYQLRVVSGVTVQESPLWLQRRLWNAGVRPVNNIVDITNLIMLGYGQPLHAFDYDQLGTNKLAVRYAKAKEPLTTLEGTNHELTPEDIVITNGERPVALAGVMGGLATEITPATTTVVIEAAVFAPVAVRKTALRYNLRSQASARFEKGVDVASVNLALDEAARLMAALGQGTVAKGHISATSITPKPVTLAITLERINHVLGTQLDVQTVQDLFLRLGFGVTVAGEALTVTVPPRRWDIAIEADLIEEVARLYGYDQLPSTLPTTRMTLGQLTPDQRRLRGVRKRLEGLGATQVITYSLVQAADAAEFALTSKEATTLAWPMTEDHAQLRQNLVTGLVHAASYNVARKQTDLALYEQGRVFLRATGQKRPEEREYVAGAFSGNVRPKDWHQAAQPVDFYYVKGVVAATLADFRLAQPVQYLPITENPALHPGQSAEIRLGETVIGLLGRLHPSYEKAHALLPTFVFELDLTALMAADHAALQVVPAPKFPAVSRDVAVLVAETVTNAKIAQVIQANGGHDLERVTVFDVYAGANLAPGQKSLAYTLTYRRDDRTLTEEEVNAAFDKVIAALQRELHAVIR